MQLRYALTTLLLALCCADNVLGRQTTQRSQDSGNGASVSPSTVASESPTSTGQTSSTSNASTSHTKTENESPKSTATTSSATSKGNAAAVITTSHPTVTPATHGSKATNSSQDAQLPIEPTITPAVGIAGVLLIVTGVAYTIIGIKHQWLLVFLSAAYLTSLACTVLIIYVMSPPVSNALQGGYFVGVLFPGLLFGGLSLVFVDITEGLGCLLGGFCLSMWFLVLRPGGLISSSTGRAIMIGVFCAVGWSLSFSRYTREYGLIFCTAFAGAMITILGIDCFSRAGLKEFWIYIWALNNEEFPIHTLTYPITRGIRVEIAATIVVFLFGIMSQIKIWKVVKERRSKKEAARQDEENRRDMRDSAIGKRVETHNERSRQQWEAVYGDGHTRRTPGDSGVGTSVGSDPKKSAGITEREVESFEMEDMDGPSNQHASSGSRTSNMSRRSLEERVRLQHPDLQLNLETGDYSWWSDFRSATNKSNKDSRPSIDLSFVPDTPPVPPGPPLMSLPFSPLGHNDGVETPNNGSEVSKAAEEDVSLEKPGAPLNKTALKKLNERAPAALPRIDDDRASSVAATADDELDTRGFSANRLSVALSNYQLEAKNSNLSPFADDFRVKHRDQSTSRTTATPGTPGEAPVLENDDEELLRPLNPNGGAGESVKQEDGNQHHRELSTASDRRATGSDDNDDSSDADDAASIHSLKDHLPEGMSKVAMAYRTNEWAKHITEADQPADEEEVPAEVEEPGVQVEINRPPKETPRPVETDALLETGAPTRKSPKTSTNPYRQNKEPKAVRRQSSSATPIYAFQREGSYPSLQRQGSGTSFQQQKRETRNASAPLSQQAPLVESPMETGSVSSYQDFATPLGSTNNLLDDRNHRMKKKITTTSFNALSTTPNMYSIVPSDAEGQESGNNTPPEPQQFINEEDLTLAERKALMQQGVIQTGLPPRTRVRAPSAPVPDTLGRMNSTTNQNLIYDSHQPKRSNTSNAVKQNAMLTQWRQSLQQEANSKPNAVAEEHARIAMLNQRRVADYRHSREKAQRESSQSMRDVAMRTQQLTDRHQDAMRRMQAKANANAAPRVSMD